MATEDSLIDVQEAARRLHRTPAQVRRYLRQGRLKGRRINNRWFLDESEIKDEPAVLSVDSDGLTRKLDRLLADIMEMPQRGARIVEFKRRDDP